TDLRGKARIFSHPVYLSLKEFSLQDSRGGSFDDTLSVRTPAIFTNVAITASVNTEQPAQ
ncbi:hypothetical protein, partial [Phytobacter sp. V91]|uniref:hypothetical protein n=1 Tax=Phytobacter sp. V91 TaxID=3369425 RepID=UPI003F5DD640